MHTNSMHSIHHLSFQLFLFSFQEHFLPDQNCNDDEYLARLNMCRSATLKKHLYFCNSFYVCLKELPKCSILGNCAKYYNPNAMSYSKQKVYFSTMTCKLYILDCLGWLVTISSQNYNDISSTDPDKFICVCVFP